MEELDNPINDINSDVFYLNRGSKKFRIWIWGRPEGSENIPAIEIDEPTGIGTYGNRRSTNILSEKLPPWEMVLSYTYDSCVKGKDKIEISDYTSDMYIIERLNRRTGKLEIIYQTNDLNIEILNNIVHYSEQMQNYLACRMYKQISKGWK